MGINQSVQPGKLFINSLVSSNSRVGLTTQSVIAGTVAAGDAPFISADASLGTVFVILPRTQPPVTNVTYIIKKNDGSSNPVIISSGSGDTVVNNPTYSLTTSGQS